MWVVGCYHQKSSEMISYINKNKIVVIVVTFFLIFPHASYRFKHPEKTETQLFLDFFKAYKELYIELCRGKYGDF